jgi:hypothetical protein
LYTTRVHSVAIIADPHATTWPLCPHQLYDAFYRICVMSILDEFEDSLIRAWIQLLTKAAKDIGRKPNMGITHELQL